MDLDLAEAKKALEQEKKDRVEACGKELKAVLERHKCSLAPWKVSRAGVADVWSIDVIVQEEK